jgi:hypothetical protein
VVIDAAAAQQRNLPLQHKAKSLKTKDACQRVIAEWTSTEPNPDLTLNLLKGLKSLKKARINR